MWADIGEDVAHTLAHELTLPAIGRALCVCKAWKSLLEDDDIWQRVALSRHAHWPFSAHWLAAGNPSGHPLLQSGWRTALYYRTIGETTAGVAMTQPAKRMSVAQMFVHGGKYRPQKKREKVPGAPRLPTSSYFFFCERLREENPERKISATECAAAWKELSAAEREPHHEAALIDRARFAIEKGLWIKGLEPDDLRTGLRPQG
jgi:hypothetical protein|eukprot:2805988-Prymnesium_polylepis.1